MPKKNQQQRRQEELMREVVAQKINVGEREMRRQLVQKDGPAAWVKQLLPQTPPPQRSVGAYR